MVIEVVGQGPHTSNWSNSNGDKARLIALGIKWTCSCLAKWHDSQSTDEDY